jgi:hypothetical protein
VSILTYAHVCSRMLTYAHVCSRMLTYAHVCSRMLTYGSGITCTSVCGTSSWAAPPSCRYLIRYACAPYATHALRAAVMPVPHTLRMRSMRSIRIRYANALRLCYRICYACARTTLPHTLRMRSHSAAATHTLLVRMRSHNATSYATHALT